MTQMQIEQFTHEEYCHFLSYGDPKSPEAKENAYDRALDTYNLFDLDNLDQELDWISTLDSTTYPGMTFGYSVAPYMYTSL